MEFNSKHVNIVNPFGYSIKSSWTYTKNVIETLYATTYIDPSYSNDMPHIIVCGDVEVYQAQQKGGFTTKVDIIIPRLSPHPRTMYNIANNVKGVPMRVRGNTSTENKMITIMNRDYYRNYVNQLLAIPTNKVKNAEQQNKLSYIIQRLTGRADSLQRAIDNWKF